jgi:hypothetical protein
MLTPPVVTPPRVTNSATTTSGDETPDPAPADDSLTLDILVTRTAVSIFESLLTVI